MQLSQVGHRSIAQAKAEVGFSRIETILLLKCECDWVCVCVCINPQNFNVFPVAFYSPIRRQRRRLLCSCLYGFFTMLYVLLFTSLSLSLTQSIFFFTIFYYFVVEFFVSLSRYLLLGQKVWSRPIDQPIDNKREKEFNQTNTYYIEFFLWVCVSVFKG